MLYDIIEEFDMRFLPYKYFFVILICIGNNSPLIANIDLASLIRDIEKNQHLPFSFVAKIKVSSYKDNNLRTSVTMELRGMGLNKSLGRFLTPEVDRGKAVLMVNEGYWFYFPKTRKAIKISSRQTLLGDAYIGDVVKPPIIKNYNIKLLKNIKEKRDTIYIIELVAKEAAKVPYHKIIVHYSPLKKIILYEELYSESNIMLKKAYYSNHIAFGNILFPEIVKIENTIQKNQYTVVEFMHIKEKELNPNVFDVTAIPYIPYEY